LHYPYAGPLFCVAGEKGEGKRFANLHLFKRGGGYEFILSFFFGQKKGGEMTSLSFALGKKNKSPLIIIHVFKGEGGEGRFLQEVEKKKGDSFAREGKKEKGE